MQKMVLLYYCLDSVAKVFAYFEIKPDTDISILICMIDRYVLKTVLFTFDYVVFCSAFAGNRFHAVRYA